MFSKVASIILLSLIVGVSAPAQQSGGCMVAGADLPAALAQAQAGPHCLEVPAGVYVLTGSSGVLLPITVDDMEIKGAGIGKTIIQTSPITLTGNLIVFRTTAARTHIHDLTIAIGATYAPPGSERRIHAVNAYIGAVYPRFVRMDISGIYGVNAAGGSGVDMYQPPSVNGGRQDGLVEDVTVRDSSLATGFIINSSGNMFRRNTVRNVGSTSLQHGFYVQGGYNTLDGNLIDHVSGYSIHAYKNAAGQNGTGDRYIGNTSINPGFQHVIVTGTSNRHVEISGNRFAQTNGRETNGIVTSAPALIANNVFEDVFKSGCGGVIRVTTEARGSIVTGNRLLYPTITGWTVCAAIALEGAGSIARDNILDISPIDAGIVVGERAAISGNQIASTSINNRRAIRVQGTDAIILGNIIDIKAGMGIGPFSGPMPARTQILANTIIINGVAQ